MLHNKNNHIKKNVHNITVHDHICWRVRSSFCKLVRARLIHRAETHVDGFRVPQVFQGLAGQDGIKFCFAGFDIISIVFIICHEQFYGETVPASTPKSNHGQSMNIDDNTWTSSKIFQNQMQSMIINEIQWQSLHIHRHPPTIRMFNHAYHDPLLPWTTQV